MTVEQGSSPSSAKQEHHHWVVAYARCADESQASDAFDIANAADLQHVVDEQWKVRHVEQLAVAARRPDVVHTETAEQAVHVALTRAACRALSLTPAFSERVALQTRVTRRLAQTSTEGMVLMHWCGAVELTRSTTLWAAGFVMRCTCARGTGHRGGLQAVPS